MKLVKVTELKWSKNIRVMVWVGLLVIALLVVVRSKMSIKSELVVISISEDSACRDIIKEGSSIRQINGIKLNTQEDFSRITKDLEGITTFVVDGNPRTCNIPENSPLNVIVKVVEGKWLNFGVDVDEGIMFLIRPTEEVSLESSRCG